MSRRNENEGSVLKHFTSMIDVVFLLLIFFMLQPFKSPEMSLRAELPHTDGLGTTPPPAMPTRVDVRGHGDQVTLYVNNHKLSGNGAPVTAAVTRECGGAPAEESVVLNADSAVHFEHMLTAYDACLAAGVKKVSLRDPGQRQIRQSYER